MINHVSSCFKGIKTPSFISNSWSLLSEKVNEFAQALLIKIRGPNYEENQSLRAVAAEHAKSTKKESDPLFSKGIDTTTLAKRFLGENPQA